MAMKTWTIVGFYESEWQAFADSIEAADEFAAMALIGERLADTDLIIVGAVEGAHNLSTPGDDNGSLAYASDLADLA